LAIEHNWLAQLENTQVQDLVEKALAANHQFAIQAYDLESAKQQLLSLAANYGRNSILPFAVAEIMRAVLNAGAARFRPVMLTSLTTFIGLIPLLSEQSTQTQCLIPMAVSLGFSILFATYITLILVPVNYLIIKQLTGKTTQLFQAR
jgi:hypothetical protein